MTIPSTTAALPADRETAAAAPEAAARAARAVLEAEAIEARRAEVKEVAPTHPGQKGAMDGSFLIGSVRVQFEFDRELGEMIAQVIDPASGDLIRQMPSEEAVQVAKVLGRLQGLLVQQTA